MLLISDLDIVAPDLADRIRQIARSRVTAWKWPYWVALDYVLMAIERNMCKRTNTTFIPNDTSCRLYEQGRVPEL